MTKDINVRNPKKSGNTLNKGTIKALKYTAGTALILLLVGVGSQFINFENRAINQAARSNEIIEVIDDEEITLGNIVVEKIGEQKICYDSDDNNILSGPFYGLCSEPGCKKCSYNEEKQDEIRQLVADHNPNYKEYLENKEEKGKGI